MGGFELGPVLPHGGSGTASAVGLLPDPVLSEPPGASAHMREEVPVTQTPPAGFLLPVQHCTGR